MDANQASDLLSSSIIAAVPLMYAGLGELITEKSGVMNLGVEGMMLMGAVCGYAVATLTGHPWLGVIAAIAAGMAMALLFGVITLSLRVSADTVW